VVGATFETFLQEPRRYSETQIRQIMQVAFATREVKSCLEQIEIELRKHKERISMDKKVKIIVERTYTGEKPVETVFKEIYAENMRMAVRNGVLWEKRNCEECVPVKKG